MILGHTFRALYPAKHLGIVTVTLDSTCDGAGARAAFRSSFIPVHPSAERPSFQAPSPSAILLAKMRREVVTR